MFQIKTKLLYNKRIKANFLCCMLDAPKLSGKAYPGQFVNIKISDGSDPLLRRPFSIHRVKGASLEILYEVVGKATQVLSEKKAGEYLDVIGPLGNGFSPLASRLSLLVAGGMGVAPLIFLAEKLREIQNPKSKIQNLILIGGKSKDDILCEKEFKELGCEVKIATDDGSRGFKGKVTDLLNKVLHGTRYTVHGTTIYACGPRPMLKATTQISKKYKIPAQISLEEHMACGIGACFGCTVKTINGYKRVCKEGPVFKADAISW